MKSRIFIGSSSEYLKVAQQIKDYLQPDFDAFLWTDDIFETNKSAFDTLLTAANLFDFGIMLITKDDVVKSRGGKFDSPRDNAVFELGIFLGRLGPDKAFAVVEKGTKLPTDLNGITLEEYSADAKSGTFHSMDEGLRRITKKIKESEDLSHLGMLSETALTIGYFKNFIKPMAESICKGLKTRNGVVITKLNIVIPNGIFSDMRGAAEVFYASRALALDEISATNGRPLKLFVEADSGECFDYPTTFEGLGGAIDLYLHEGHVGKSKKRLLLESHQLSNFRRALAALIMNDAFAKCSVLIVNEKDASLSRK